jgi:hypothetical protein
MSLGKRWYIRDHINGQPQQLWLFDFDNQTATPSPEVGPGTFFRAEPGEDIWDCIRRQTSWSDPERLFHAMTLGPGKYYPRIDRPLVPVPAWEPRLLWSQSFNVENAYVAMREASLHHSRASLRRSARLFSHQKALWSSTAMRSEIC